MSRSKPVSSKSRSDSEKSADDHSDSSVQPLEDGSKDHKGTKSDESSEGSSDGQEPSLSEKSDAESKEEQQSSREPHILAKEVDKSKGGVFRASSVVLERDLLFASIKVAFDNSSASKKLSFIIDWLDRLFHGLVTENLKVKRHDAGGIADGGRLISDRDSIGVVLVSNVTFKIHREKGID